MSKRATVTGLIPLCFCLSGSLFVPPVSASEPEDTSPPVVPEDLEIPDDLLLDEEGAVYDIPEVLVPYTPKDVFRVGGSAQLVSQETLEALEYDDPNSVLLTIPGVYVRQEDGYGLRPNIGLRGANSERSKKVTLMEDGVLFAPAPYSAPAAYYFPLMTRLVGMEVFKGPSSIVYGPNTIGGAINLQTREVPRGSAGGIDLSLGLDRHAKTHVHIGHGGSRAGFLVEAVHLQSDGFKELDGGGDTGFSKQEVMVKGRLNTDPAGHWYHRLDLKLGASTERSNETYLGLSDADFRSNPDRRYAASALDQMNLDRLQLVLSHGMAVGDHVEVKTTFYRHDVSRAWAKVGRFSGGPSLSSILADPSSGQPQVYYRILAGQEESTSDVDQLMLGTNARTFVSQGIQTLGELHFGGRERSLDIEAGLRLHYDEILRDHSEIAMDMLEGQLTDIGDERSTSTLSLGSTFAVAGHLAAAIGFHGLTVTPGLRVESMKTRLDNHLSNTVLEAGETVPLFGVGLHYGITETLGVLAGVHQGFSPVAPGQPDEVASERSLGFEAGARYAQPGPGTSLEVVGFYSDYSNISGQCSFSAGCTEDQLDDQFNGGAASIYGVEFVAANTFNVTGSLRVPARLMYTFTRATFANDFSSPNPQWGEVVSGDELPYVPAHQASVSLGLESDRWGISTVGTFLDAMREVAGGADDTDEADPGALTDRALMLDGMGHWNLDDNTRVYVRVENVLNQRPIVSRRPYGARPGKPFMAMTGLKVQF